MNIDVFISYSTKDIDVANAICCSLEASGIRCWIAHRDIVPGSDWAESINTAIKSSAVMVLVFSESSNNSTQVAKELNLAISNKLVILPFKIDQSAPTGSMEYYLSDTHWLQASSDITDEITSLTEVVVSALTQSHREVNSAERKISGKTKKRAKSKRIGIIAALVILMIFIGFLDSNIQKESWDCFVEKYSLVDNKIVGGEDGIKQKKLSDIDGSFGLIHSVEIKDDIPSVINLDQEQESTIAIKSNIRPSAITYLCGNNGPYGTISGDDVPYEKNISAISIPAYALSSDGYSSGDRYRIRIVVAYEEKISSDFYEVEKFYFDKNLKVQ